MVPLYLPYLIIIMYIPQINLTTDRKEIIEFMKRFSFATIITSTNGVPLATHLPFLIEERNDQIVLSSHFAKANDHWKDLEAGRPLVIFTEPHAYISTSNYDKELNVPTWNYIAVHCYGTGKIVPEVEPSLAIINATIDHFEADYRKQWDNFPEDYKLKMLRGIVAFELVVDELQAKKKLSQNRSEAEKDKIISTLTHSESTTEQLIAEYMRKE